MKTILPHFRVALAAFALTSAIPLTSSHAGGLGGEASRFQIFSIGDLQVSNSSPNGAVATGGDFVASGTSIGSGLDPQRDSVIVAAGDVTLSNGTYQNGNIVVGGTPNIAASAGLTNARVVQLQTSIDFQDAQDEYSRLSERLAGIEATGETFVYSWRAIELRGLQDGLNVFNITESQYEQSNGIAVPDFDPNVHTVVINVAGDNVLRGSNGSLFVGQVNSQTTYQSLANRDDFSRHQRLLWNFHQATSLVSNGSIHGAILAPGAHLTHQNGQLVGQVIAGSVDLRNAARIATTPFLGELAPPRSSAVNFD